MLGTLFAGAIAEARLTARRAVLGAIAAVLGLIGTGFLASAAWIWLARQEDALFASLILGGAFMAISVLFLALARRRYNVRDLRAAGHAGALAARTPGGTAPGNVTTLLPVAEAFLVGFGAGLRRK